MVRRAFAGVLAALVVACSADQAVRPTETLREPPRFALVALSACNSSNANSAVGGLVRFYSCGQKIRFVRYQDGTPGNGDSSGTAAMMTALDGQLGPWNNGPLGPVDLNLPQLVSSTSSGAAYTVQVKFSGGTGAKWCGQVLAANGAELGPGTPPGVLLLGNGNCGTLNEVARHEIAHVLGLLANQTGSDWHKKSPSVFGHCTVSIIGTGASQVLAQTMCPHLKEIMYGLYGVITRPINPSKHIITIIQGNASLTVQDGQTVSAAPTNLLAGSANFSLCNPGASGSELAQSCEFPLTSGYNLSYSSDNTSVATVNASSGLVTGVAPGTAVITRTVTTLPSQFQTSSVIGGGTVNVTVTAAPAIARIVAGDGITVPPGTVVTPAPQVQVLASDGVTPVANVSVTFGSPSGGSTLTGTSRTTNSSGFATVGSWTLGTTLGSYTMVATVGASVSPNPLTFHATAGIRPPTGFGVDPSGCRDKSTSVSYKLKWTPGDGATYEIRHGTVNDVSAATLMSSGSATISSTVTPFYSKTVPPLVHYWWLRELNSGGVATGPWIPNFINGQITTDGCVF